MASVSTEVLTEASFAPVVSPTAVVAPSGFATRRDGGCFAGEQLCGNTTYPFVGCFPGSTTCGSNQYNDACCPTSANCTDSLITHPGCANVTWNMFDNGGFFCCDTSTWGYQYGTGSICLTSEDDAPGSVIKLPLIQKGVAASSFSTNSTSASSASTSSSSGSTSTSHTSGGAIAGIVIGCVVVIALLVLGIWLLRRNRLKQETTQAKGGGFGIEQSKGLALDDQGTDTDTEQSKPMMGQRQELSAAEATELPADPRFLSRELP